MQIDNYNVKKLPQNARFFVFDILDDQITRHFTPVVSFTV